MKYIAIPKVDNNIIIHGDECVTNLRELYIALAQTDTTEIEIRKDFADKFFTYTALCDFVENSATIAPNVNISVQDTVNDNMTFAVDGISIYKDVESLIYALETKPEFILQTIHSLCKYYRDTHDEQNIANSKIATLSVQVTELERELAASEAKQKSLQDQCNDVFAKLHALVSRTNFRYEKTINPDKLFLSGPNNYNHILYIKEISRVHYTDTLIYYVQEIMRTMYGVPMRSIVIEPYYAYDRAALYDGYKPHWKLNFNDVYSGNIFMAGYQPKLMDDILQNANRVNYMIVLDRGGYSVPHITGNNVSVVYTVSDINDIESVPYDNVLSYSEATLNIPYIPDFENLSPESRIQKYSTMAVTKRFINLLEEV